ncbi:MAG TPA: heavy metal translocating P-type ATPase [Isosphaeraceae bacterium]|nr:heavy metal translocating P-type ATPase [Isosphaeraceae bacterium]
MRCQLVHAVPGRARFRIDEPEVFVYDPGALESWLRGQAGVRQARVNPTSRSVVVLHDPRRVRAEDLLDRLTGFDRVHLRDVPTAQARPAAAEHDHGLQGWPLTLSTAAACLAVGQSALAPWVLAGAAIPVFRRAYDVLFRQSRLNVDVLDASATTVLLSQGSFGTAAIMVWLISLGDLLRNFTMQRSLRTIEGLYEGKDIFTWVVRNHKAVRVKVEELRTGEEVIVYPGESIPVDGTVLSGTATVDQRMLTGESLPVTKGAGDPVFAGTVSTEGKLHVRADRVGAETMASRIVEFLLNAPLGETRTLQYEQLFADRIVPYSFLGAGGSLLATASVDMAASLLIVDFGTGIRVAAPTTVLAAMAKAARQRVLIKGGRSLERLAEVDTIVFDKTGTLTTATPEVVRIVTTRGTDPDRLLSLAAAAEAGLTHPVAQAILRAAEGRGLTVPEREDSDYRIGLGVRSRVQGLDVLVGSARFLTSQGVAPPGTGRTGIGRSGTGRSHLYVAVAGSYAGRIDYRDPLRPEAVEVVQALRARGLDEIVMLTGDTEDVARSIARSVGIDRVVAGVFPEEKAEFVRSLQRQGRTVAVVGDGINDSLCLAQADVGIAVHGSSDVARETAQIALLEESLWKIPEALDIAREAISLIRQGWGINFYPNCAAIGLTLLGLTGPIGTTLISNGAALLATLNGLRPLLDSGSEDPIESGTGRRLPEKNPIKRKPRPLARKPA